MEPGRVRLVKLLAAMSAAVAAVALALSVAAFIELGERRYTVFSIIWTLALVYALRSLFSIHGYAEGRP